MVRSGPVCLTMRSSCILLLVVLTSSTSAAKAKSYKETREVESGGTTFSCKYTISYNGETVDQSKSSVKCSPKKNGDGPVTEDFSIDAIDKTVSVTMEIKKGKGTKIAIQEATEAPVAGQQQLSCQCRMPLFDSPPTAMGRVLVKPSTSRSLLTSLVPKLTDRQLFGNLGSGSNIDLGSLLGGSSGGGSNDLVNQIVMQMVQQQMDDFINNGGAEAMLTEMIENGQLEQMVTQMVESGMLESTMQQMMESGVIEQAIQQGMEQMMESNGMNGGLEELVTQMMEANGMDGGLEEFMAEMMEANGMNGGLEELLGQLMGGQIDQESMAAMMENFMMENMDMNLDCDCVPAI